MCAGAGGARSSACIAPFSRLREKVPEGRMRGLFAYRQKAALTPTPLPQAGEGLQELQGCKSFRAYKLQSFSAPFSTIVLPSSVTVLPGRNTAVPYDNVFSPPAQALPPNPTDTLPAGIHAPTGLDSGSFTFGLMPKLTKLIWFLRSSAIASYSAL